MSANDEHGYSGRIIAMLTRVFSKRAVVARASRGAVCCIHIRPDWLFEFDGLVGAKRHSAGAPARSAPSATRRWSSWPTS